MSDWDDSDDETTTKVATPAVVTVKPLVKKTNKWEGEDEEDGGPVVSILLASPNLRASHSHLHPLGLWIR